MYLIVRVQLSDEGHSQHIRALLLALIPDYIYPARGALLFIKFQKGL